MIKSLHLTNFRRHADLDLRFDDDKQLILIAGGNGSGKSSILEAIQFALWGESRHGRRGLGGLVKRGSELEGMSVEMTFTIGGDEYRVHRRRDGKASTALLTVNDIDIAEGPQQVTEEVSKLMGMDSAGFRLAVVAQQKDLDGLASLRAADRAQMVTRLLKLDALTAAKVQAGTVFRHARDQVAARRGIEEDELLAEVTAADTALALATEELNRSQSAMTLLDAELAATEDVEALWQASSQAVARIDGAITQLTEALAAREVELTRIVVPQTADGQEFDIAALSLQLAEVEREIALGEAAARTVAQRQAVASELARVNERLVEVQTAASAMVPDIADLVERQQSLAALEVAKDVELQNLQASLGRAQGDVVASQKALAKAEAQEGTCSECGQDVSAEHRHSQIDKYQGELAAAESALADLTAQLEGDRAGLAGLRARLDEAATAVAAARADVAARDRAISERDDLLRRVGAYTSQLERLPEATVELDALYARKAELSLEMTSANEAAALEKARAAALTRRDALRDDIAGLQGQLIAKRAERVAAEPSSDLEGRYKERQFTLENRRAEAELGQYWQTEVAVATERKAAAERRHTENQKRLAEQSAWNTQAVNAAAAQRLLGDVADRLATQIRPSLEGAVGSLLATMSDGRFSAVRIDPDYEITVEDDGEFRALGELSGGEVDLVALATRLALAQVVSDRHGAGGAGFLILDECFGSQDPQRRASILDALRTLRDTYSQIFLISHVENIEDAADVVVTVKASEDRSETEVIVS